MEISVKQTSKRLPFLDLAKLISMMCIIAGHRLGKRLFKMFVHSFHVPIFFVVSGFTFSFSKDWKSFLRKTLKRFVRLMIAFYITVIAMMCVDLIIAKGALPKEYWIYEIYKFIGNSKTNFAEVFACWFLFALFTTSTLFDGIHLVFSDDRKFGFACCILTVLGVTLGTLFKVTPLYFDIALAVQFFMFFGYKLRSLDFSKIKLWHSLLLLAIWGSTMVIMWFSKENGTYMTIADRRYTMFPLCYICASAGSILVLQLCYYVCKLLPRVSKPFCFLGRYTLYMVCIHTFAWFCFPKWFKYTSNLHLNNLIYFGIGSAIFFVILACDLLIHHSIRKKKEQQAVIA